ncbi:ArnT family glycosyltransferase [Pelosinus propionicus]|uniref:4-amino-4-deoxy-L-arabinose transferase n=1 Tax=Pelosinus propionicus DSM 13327 TaxID=1123291 RepID=A0A1I4LQH4_9FIRM|nr:glycosyltransferase family 39 protein [Pelosinus propionicus]SFL93274.1 4-amino-4-deoxy-L-arabinose transferase [Pelosinus propionicus DSM 13327]
MNVKTSDVITDLIHSKQKYLGIFLLSFFFYMFFSHMMPITDPVESNYALTAKEMVLSADWISPRIYGNIWFDKPVFFYWTTAIAFQLFGFSEWAARIPPAFFASVGLVLMYWFTLKIVKPRVAILAVLVMGTSFEYIVLAKLIVTDMVFFVFNCAALGFFYLGYVNLDGSKKRWYQFGYVSMALAVLTKGPIGVLLPGLVILVFIAVQRKWSQGKEWFIPSGIFLFAAVALPWYAAMYAMHGTEFINSFFGVHNYLRATVSEHPKDNVSYYYIAVFILSMLPWSALAIKALIQGCRDFRSQSSPLLLFLFLWTAAYFGFYSLMATKYLTYTFPIVFPVSIITAIHLEKMLAEGKKAAIVYWAVVPFVLLLLVYMIVAYRYLAGLGLIITVGSLLLLLLLFFYRSNRRTAADFFKLLCWCQLGAYIILCLFVFPAMAQSRSGKEIAESIAGMGKREIGMYEFYSTSEVFYSGNIPVKIEKSSVLPLHQPGEMDWSSKYTMPIQGLVGFMAQSSNSLIVVPDTQKNLFLVETDNFKPKLIKSDNGWNYYYLNH